MTSLKRRLKSKNGFYPMSSRSLARICFDGCRSMSHGTYLVSVLPPWICFFYIFHGCFSYMVVFGDVGSTAGVTVGAGAAGAVFGALSASFNPFPALNFGTITSGIWIFSFGACGLTPIRAFRVLDMKAPNPAIFTSPPDRKVDVTTSTNASTTASACCLLRPHFSDK